MAEMIATEDQDYGVPLKRVKAKERFTVEPEHVGLLALLGKAVPVEHYEELGSGSKTKMSKFMKRTVRPS